MATSDAISPNVSYYTGSRRESSPKARRKGDGRQRPRLLRASATEPSISTLNSSKGVMTPSHSTTTRKATDLLSRVAVTSASGSPPSSSSARSPVYEAGAGQRYDYRLAETSHTHCSACYFSFPSFDTWEGREHADEEKAKG